MFEAPIVPLTATLAPMPDGMAGVFHTLRTMRALVNRYKVDPFIRQSAISIIFTTPAKFNAGEIQALYEAVRDNIRYVRDVHGIETLSTPDKTLLTRAGDCDDQVTLLASLLESVGFSTRFVVAGYFDQPVSHVYLQVLDDEVGWVDLDPTEHESYGWAPPGPTSLYIEGL